MKTKNLLLVTFVFAFMSAKAIAQDLVAATSEDQEKWEQTISQANANGTTSGGKQAADTTKGKSADAQKKHKKANFGEIVSAEAHKLNDSGRDSKAEMGKWVSDQRRKDDQNGAATASSARSQSDSAVESHSNTGSSKRPDGTSGRRGGH